MLSGPGWTTTQKEKTEAFSTHNFGTPDQQPERHTPPPIAHSPRKYQEATKEQLTEMHRVLSHTKWCG